LKGKSFGLVEFGIQALVGGVGEKKGKME